MAIPVHYYPPDFFDHFPRRFFQAVKCDRCGGSLRTRAVSFFNWDIICKECIYLEDEAKAKLAGEGIDVKALDQCGAVPESVRTIVDPHHYPATAGGETRK